MKSLLVSLIVFASTFAQAQTNPIQVHCVDWRYVPAHEVSINTLSPSAQEHLGADFEFEVITRSEDGATVVSAGVAVETQAPAANVRGFDLFRGAPYVKNPARADGRLVVVTDPSSTTQPSLTWDGKAISLMQCQAL